MSARRPVLAIDPGLTESGVVLWDGAAVLSTGVVPNERVLVMLSECSHPVACEMIASYGMAVGKTVFETCVWIGRMAQTAYDKKVDFNFIFRQEVKLHLCHSTRAKDSNVRQALIDRFGDVGTKKEPGPLFGVKSHAWAALALAVTFHDKVYATSTSSK